MEWIKKHTDTVIVLGAVLSSVIWMNSKFGEVQKEIAELKTETAIIKTVLIMKNIMPQELAQNEADKNE